MATPTAFEQLTLELINQARLNPHGEFERWVINAPANVQSALTFFNVNLTLLEQQFNALTPVAAVAWNEQLGDSSQTHTDLMAAFDSQSHNLPGEPSLSQRFINAGYTGFSNISENIFAFAEDAVQAHAAFFIDWGNTPTGIQDPPGHRNAIMNPIFTEVGVGHTTDVGAVGPNLVTHHFGNRFGYTSQITGVVFNDGDGDRFYAIGEGVGGTTISAATGSTTNWSSGGYNLDLAPGTHTLTFNGALGSASIRVNLGTENIKVHMFDPGSFRSSVSATLGAGGLALELLGENAINASGNGGSDRLIGNSAKNILDGKTGGDVMIGREGNDRYYVDNTADQVIELKDEGTDHVVSTVSFSLAGQYIEWLTLTGSANINGTGNSLENKITGNDARNIIDGGKSADTMAGKDGNDRYYVDNRNDKVIELKNEGIDHIVSTVSFSLAGQYIEWLTLSGTGNINAGGNSLGNKLTGNSGNNTLNGGTGNDTLTGGGGIDFFKFNTALGANNVDTITDFQVNVDKILLDDAIFAAVGTSLTASEFVANATGVATTDAQHILYNTSNGRLYFDADGSGGQARTHFATLSAGLALDHLDFLMI